MLRRLFRRPSARFGLFFLVLPLAGCVTGRSPGQKTFPPPTPPNAVYAVDSKGNKIVAGTFDDELRLGNEQARSSGGADAFVGKLDADGKAWLRTYGGVGDQTITSVAVDAEDNILVAGVFHRTMRIGDTTLEVPDLLPRNRGVFVAKLDPTGKILWAQNPARVAAATAVSVAAGADGKISVGASIIGAPEVSGQVLETKASMSVLVSELVGKTGAILPPGGAPVPLAFAMPGCTHDICVEGPPLNPYCHWCVGLIVYQAHDTYCMYVYWDSLCRYQVASVCGLTCR
jgi:hypothetical protein